ncbi:MAG: hypothetical protein E7641_05350 [Ruminococcaceae bacterium]|nr:hypothetical protein [Oscillospiraceae bacterium]
MKKISLVLALLLIFSLLASCNEGDTPPEVTTTVATTTAAPIPSAAQSPTNGSAVLEIVEEREISVSPDTVTDELKYKILEDWDIYNPSYASHVDENVEKTVSLTVGDIQFSGDYRSTRIPINMMGYKVHTYKSENYEFKIDDNGVLLGFYTFKENFGNRCIAVSEEEAIKRATDFLSNIVDVSLYSVEVEFIERTKEYCISYTRHLEEIKCTDCVDIYVSIYGNILSMSSWDLGKLPKHISLEYDIDNVWYSVEKKLDEMYAEEAAKYGNVTYEKIGAQITVDENGNQVIECAIDATYIMPAGEGLYFHMPMRHRFFVSQYDIM